MGVTGFLQTFLSTAGTEVDLRQYRDGIDVFISDTEKRRRRKRPLRIGVDVSHWIYKACLRFGPILADEKHLTNYGRHQLVRSRVKQGGTNNQQPPISSSHKTPVDPETARKYVSLCCMFIIERLEALQNECRSELIAVLDGDTPPVKKNTARKRARARKENSRLRDAPVDVMMATRKETKGVSEDFEAHLKERMKANRRAGAGSLYSDIIEELVWGMREKNIAFLVAPYEADGQLAWMSKEKIVDLVVTEDSDLIAQGALCMMYKIDVSLTYRCSHRQQTENGSVSKYSFAPKGILLRKDDLGSVTISRRRGSDVRLLDMSAAMLAVVFVAVDSDYCNNLRGIGFVTACEIVQSCFLQQSRLPPLELVFQTLFQRSYEKSFQCDTNRQDEYKQQFLGALLMYRHPVVYCPFTKKYIVANLDEEDAALTQYLPYQNLLRKAKLCAQDLVIGGLIEGPKASLIPEGWVSPRSLNLYGSAKQNRRLPEFARLLFDLTDSMQEGRADGHIHGELATAVEEDRRWEDVEESMTLKGPNATAAAGLKE